MSKLVLIMAIAAFGLFAGAAWAKPVTISTTQGDVQKQCGNKLGCSAFCGRASCDYECKGKKCTVTISDVHAGGSGSTSGGASEPVR